MGLVLSSRVRVTGGSLSSYPRRTDCCRNKCALGSCFMSVVNVTFGEGGFLGRGGGDSEPDRAACPCGTVNSRPWL